VNETDFYLFRSVSSGLISVRIFRKNKISYEEAGFVWRNVMKQAEEIHGTVPYGMPG
jgi:hypothetical protein